MKYIGYIMIAMPFIAIFILTVRQSGIKVAFSVFGITFFIAAWILVGAYLMVANN